MSFIPLTKHRMSLKFTSSRVISGLQLGRFLSWFQQLQQTRLQSHLRNLSGVDVRETDSVTYHFIIFPTTVPRPRGTVLTVGQAEAQPDVVLAVQLLVLGDTHDQVAQAKLAHLCQKYF